MYKGSIVRYKRIIQKSPGSPLISGKLLFSPVYVSVCVCTCVFVALCMCISLCVFVVYVLLSKSWEFYESRHCVSEL